MNQTSEAGGRPAIGLLAPEMCTRGGVQSFMWRIAEALASLVREGQARGYLFSLNDGDYELRSHVDTPCELEVFGAGRSRRELTCRILLATPHLDALLVGHVGPAPLALGLMALRRIDRYGIVLHGFEAWRRGGVLTRLAASHASRVVATTQFTAGEFARLNGIDPRVCEVIPLCADERTTKPSTALALHGTFKLLCVARLDASERYKGVEHVLEALGRLRDDLPGAHLHLIGDGTDRPRLEALAAVLGVAEKVTFWGHVAEDDLASAYETCDAFVMPSSSEGFGIVFLEAMRHGKPCIGGRHGGTPEVIEDGRSGLLVPYGDVSALAAALLTLHRDRQLSSQYGHRGRELAKSRFAAGAFRDAYRALMRNMASPQ